MHISLITMSRPPKNRVGRHDDDHEHHLSEGAVMLAVASWLFDQGAEEVCVHPDGQHMKAFDMPGWLEAKGFSRVTTTGSRGLSGEFRRGAQCLTLQAKPGHGDVVTRLDGVEIEIETKGGCINTRHPGQLSRLRKGLHEAVGQLLSSPRNNRRFIAVVPFHKETERWASRLAERCSLVGIEIALVTGSGDVHLIQCNQPSATARSS